MTFLSVLGKYPNELVPGVTHPPNMMTAAAIIPILTVRMFSSFSWIDSRGHRDYHDA
jgi:hypothetical protein